MNVRQQRDATKIVDLCNKAELGEISDKEAREAIKPIAARMDARTGKIDPSLRKVRGAKKTARRGRK